MAIELISVRSQPEPDAEPPLIWHWTAVEWSKLLQLAADHGWKPEGTVPSQITGEFYLSGREWDGDYYRSEFQVITPTDAQAMADALTLALKDLPDHNVLDLWTQSYPDLCSYMDADLQHLASPRDFFSGPQAREKLLTFIDFCRLDRGICVT